MLAFVLVLGIFSIHPLKRQVLIQIWGLNQLHFSKFRQKLKSRLSPAVEKRFFFSSSESELSVPKANLTGGVYPHPLQIHLSHEFSDVSIRYTLDGSIPTQQSQKYQGPISIAETTVLRFRGFQPNNLPSDTVTHTYFIGTKYQLPVLSLVTDPVNLWNKHSGIYANPTKQGKKWEREADVEYSPDKDRPSLWFSAGLRIHGGYSRGSQKKSFRLIYNPELLTGKDVGNILTQESNAKERVVILHALGGWGTFFWNDVLFDAVYSEAGGLTSPISPVVLFLNGEFWGIYNLRERIDQEYLVQRFGRADYDLIEETEDVICGDAEHWRQTLEFFRTHDLTIPEEFDKAVQLVDIRNLTDYWLFNIYAANADWPQTNTKRFCRRNPSSPWRWISWDADWAFYGMGRGGGVRHNTLAWAIRSRLRQDLRHNFSAGLRDTEDALMSTLIVRGLLQNRAYRQQFILRFLDLLNSDLLPERVQAKLEKIIQVYSHEAQADLERWKVPRERYLEELQADRDFISQRPQIIRTYFQKEFQLGPLTRIELVCDPPGSGKIQINSIRPESYPWTGTYFEKSGITLEAKPAQGFEFVCWTDPSLGKALLAHLELNAHKKVGAIFRRTYP